MNWFMPILGMNIVIKGIRVKRIILFVGVYDTLDIFTYELNKEFINLGYETYIFDTSDMKKGLEGFAEFVKKPVKAAITFNNLGFNMELKEGENIWDALNIWCINILMDHPFCYDRALCDAPQNGIVLCVDKNHMSYINRFYSNISITGFLPHGGKELWNEIRPISGRKIDVMYAGGLSRANAKNIIPDLSAYNNLMDVDKFCKDVYQYAIENSEVTTEGAIEYKLNELGLHISDEELRQLMADFHFLDLYIVSHYREKVVETVARAGIDICIYGIGWEICDWINWPNVHYIGRVPSYEIVNIMIDAKVVLSTMTWFKDGSHDRIFNGMLQGAVVASDTSKYMEEESGAVDGENMILFNLKEIDTVPNRIMAVLNDVELAQRIANNGYELARQKHTWAVRARELDEDLISELL